MFDKFRNIAIRESLNIEALLLWIERSQLRRFGHVSKMPQKLYMLKCMSEEASCRAMNKMA